MTEKKAKSRRQNEPENPPRKEQGTPGKIERARRKKGGESKKKAVAALLVFMLTSMKETEQ